MKSIALLATALFLASAPSPDSKTISQLSAGFLSPGNSQPLLAAEPGKTIDSSTEVASETPVKEIPAD
jgi:hypothetical protein